MEFQNQDHTAEKVDEYGFQLVFSFLHPHTDTGGLIRVLPLICIFFVYLDKTNMFCGGSCGNMR